MPRSDRQHRQYRRRLLQALGLLPLWRVGIAGAAGAGRLGHAPSATIAWQGSCHDYLQTHTIPAEREAARVLMAPLLPAAAGSPLPAALQARARADWHAGRIVTVDGWVIARTELYWHALVATGNRPERDA